MSLENTGVPAGVVLRIGVVPGDNFVAEHWVFDPPFCPLHAQDQGPLPETEDADPTEHKLATGTEEKAWPETLPH